MLKPKHRRLLWVLAGLACLGGAAALALSAFRDNLVFFRTPSDIAARPPRPSETIRLGGLVTKGSVVRDTGGVLRFTVTDYGGTIAVEYSGETPALFREGQGVVADGTLRADGVFAARRLLAKHDEKYMPPQVARKLRENGHPTGEPTR